MNTEERDHNEATGYEEKLNTAVTLTYSVSVLFYTDTLKSSHFFRMYIM